jgi:methylmalonyl-CoA epimerase
MSELKLDHIGIAVHSISEGVEFYQALGLELSGIDRVPEQGVRVGFLALGEPRIELLEPLDSSSPIARHLESRGPGIHHICIGVNDIREAMARLSDAGYRLLSDEPQAGAHGCQVCFVHPSSAAGVLIELSQPPGE